MPKACARIEFAGCQRSERYAWVERVLGAQNYGALGKGERGVVRADVEKVTGMSVSQTTRLIRAFLDSGGVRRAAYQRHGFQVRYTAGDIALLAEVDRAHERLSGPATRRILQARVRAVRAQAVRAAGGDQCGASVQLARQRALAQSSRGVRTDAVVGDRHRGAARRPDPHGRPGFLRVDTVHQGDWDGAKGVYHIHAVDAVTQWQVVGCVSKISEVYLLPCWRRCWRSFRLWCWGFTSTTARSTSIVAWRKCWTSCTRSSPRAGRAALRTTRWWRARTAPWCASAWVTDTSPASTPRRLRGFMRSS